HLALVVDEARRQPRLRDLVRRGRGNDFALVELVRGLLGALPFDLEGDEAGGERRVHRRQYLHLGDLSESLLALRIERRDAVRDALASDALVELESLGHRPLVLEGLEPAGRDPGDALRRIRRALVFPGAEGLELVESRDRRADPSPVLLRHPNDTGAARREDPLVRAGRRE